MRGRIIASTNVDIEAKMQEQNFRDDPYYRLNEIQITLPPLRERSDDVILLARSYFEEFARSYSLGHRRFAETSEGIATPVSTGRVTCVS